MVVVKGDVLHHVKGGGGCPGGLSRGTCLGEYVLETCVLEIACQDRRCKF